MQYTDYKIDPKAVTDKAESVRQVLVERGKDPMTEVVASIMKRFSLRSKNRYTDYGPYWFALKAVLNRNGQNLGEITDDEIVRQYSGQDDFETVIAADMFRDFNLATNPVGTVSYALNGYSGEAWVLRDEDMELN